MNLVRRLTIRAKLISVILGVSLAGIAALALLALFREQAGARLGMAEELQSLARLVANRSEAALAFQDEGLAQENAAALAELEQVEATCIYEGDDRLFAAYRAATVTWNCPDRVPVIEDDARVRADGILVVSPIGPESQPLGYILVRASLEPLMQRLNAQLRAQAVTAAGVGLASLLLALWLQGLISVPIKQVRDVAAQVMEHGDFSLRAPVRSADEVGDLAEHFNRMLARIETQNRDLTRLNASLEDMVRQRTAALSEALETLKRAQDELIRSEKMAALGSLVAGVAHELNTPIGNAHTVATTIEQRSNELRALVESNQVRRSQLDAYLKALSEGSALVTRNLVRARELVGSFKQVAVDQSSDKRRPFDLAEVVEETLTTLRPALRQKRYQLINAVPPGIRMDSFPGAVGQIVTNLVNNAVLHGFDGRDHGQVRFDASADGSHVSLRICDDGIGMSDEVRKRAFDPFFTTRFGQGGSGLGLSLVFNLTTGVLGGRLRLDSTPGAGTEFVFELPITAPERSGEDGASAWSQVGPATTRGEILAP